MKLILSTSALAALLAGSAAAAPVDISYRGVAGYGVTGSLAIDLSYDPVLWADFQASDGFGYHDLSPRDTTLSYSITGNWDDYTFENSGSAIANHAGYSDDGFEFQHHDYGNLFFLYTAGLGSAPGADLMELHWGTFDFDDRYPDILYAGEWSITDEAEMVSTPLPAAGLLLLAGLGGLGIARRRAG